MKKITKIMIGVCISVLIVIIGALGFAGNYFYTLAIDSRSDKTMVFSNNESQSDKDESKAISFENMMNRNTSEVWMKNKDGYNLHAYEIQNTSDVWVIAVHGYMGQASDMAAVGNIYADMGYNVLMPDLRSHGKSEGSAIGMGAWDSDDIIEWIGKINKEYKNAKIILYGISMGASTVMMTTGKNLPDNVLAAIEDCGYTSAWDEFSYQLDKLFGLPSFPALDAANFITKIRAGYNLKDADALAAVKKSKTPTLFIHGDADEFVPTRMVYPLYKAEASEKKLLIVKGAMHGGSKDVDPKTYWKTVSDFINTYVK